MPRDSSLAKPKENKRPRGFDLGYNWDSRLERLTVNKRAKRKGYKMKLGSGLNWGCSWRWGLGSGRPRLNRMAKHSDWPRLNRMASKMPTAIGMD